MTEKSSQLIDSNILIYFLDTFDQEKHDIAYSLIHSKFEEGAGVVSVQNLAEFYSNVTEKIAIPISHEVARDSLNEMTDSFNIISYTPETIARASFIQSAHRVHFWDALLAATMQENHISIIYTEDTKDFEKIPGIKAINPFDK